MLACVTQQEAPKASGQGLAWRVREQLTGVKTVIVSAPGVLLEESSPEQLQVQTASSYLKPAFASSFPYAQRAACLVKACFHMHHAVILTTKSMLLS